MTKKLTIAILNDLISFDTTSFNSNVNLINYIVSYLNRHGVDSTLVYNQENNKANLYATIGPANKPGIILSGHTDTVPVINQSWNSNPYIMSYVNGRYYGRGTTDMKGFLAVVLSSVPLMLEKPLHMPIHLAFSYDEEVGCVGVRHLIENLKGNPIKPKMCIIGEPTSMKVVTAHKGKLAIKVKITGRECHSGMAPYGVNAINYASRLVCWLDLLSTEKRKNGPFDSRYTVPFTTIHTGVINGGTALNIVPNKCEFDFEIRNISEEEPYSILSDFRDYANVLIREMKKKDDLCDIKIEVTSEYSGLNTPDDATIVYFAKKLTGELSTTTINFGTEGGLFNSILGVETVVCGPGSMEQGHKPDEFIEKEQLDKCEMFMHRLIEELKIT
ncbi:acetylornithine deacetylase [Vibrio sp. Isolate31]|uniref:acetylornithine deacetylase n=1 Tax=unclassified Vibrio TaxID=2614977 RepID=UPI001EFE567D|nr:MULTISPECIES: acetylornithine deacetylase [unclassified Vibrio]MCG9555138.1 acetylornithine deacetylase [Vibrio sp. Isolate32]MCG9602890.1 acetylornithine deacetylase [Vibrio sp. Isolate31]